MRAPPRLAATTLVTVIAVAALNVAAGPAGTHAEPRRTVPTEFATIGGPVDRVEFEFFGPIATSPRNVVRLRGPDLETISTTLAIDGQFVSARFPALTQPGTYAVFWALLDDVDRDLTANSFSFNYEPGASEPDWFIDTGGGSGSGGLIVLLAVTAIAVAVGAVLFWPRRRRATAAGSRRSREEGSPPAPRRRRR